MLFYLAAWISIGASPSMNDVAQSSIDPASLHPLEPVRIVVPANAPAMLDLPAGTRPRSYLVNVATLGISEQPAELVVQADRVSSARPLAVSTRQADKTWLARAQHQRRQMHAARTLADRPNRSHAVGKLSNQRDFYIFIQEEDFWNVANYERLTARLVATGEHCLIYVDEADSPDSFSAALIDEAIETFDKQVYPNARRYYGEHRDVDRNGKFTILFTHWLDRLCGGKVSLSGFVRGGDFYRDLAEPYSNRCDMMYLNASLQPGNHLRTIIAHEYTHAITFSEHVFGRYLADHGGQDEEAWLNEAISHLAENLFGAGWSNLDYRVSTYLAAPEEYRLVVPDYYRSGLWRCHGCRGATFLFLRWCVDRYGVDLLKELTRSNLRGVENIEVATETPFDELFRQWTLALALDGWSAESEQAYGLRSIDLRGRLGNRLLAGPRHRTISFGRMTIPMASTSFCPLNVIAPAGEVIRLRISAPPKARLQVTLVRLPDDAPEVDLEIISDRRRRGERVKLVLRHLDGAEVRWERVCCEWARIPQSNDTVRLKKASMDAADAWFPTTVSTPGSVLTSDPLDLSWAPGRTLVIKLVGTDQQGRRLAAWATHDPGRVRIASRPAHN